MKIDLYRMAFLGLALVVGSQIFFFVKNRKIEKLSFVEEINLKNISKIEKIISEKINLNQVVQSESEKNELLEILGENEISIIQLISFDSCSTCRESSVYRWKGVYSNSNKKIPIFQVISEGRLISPSMLNKLHFKAKALSDIPVFIDKKGDLVSNLGLIIDDLPVILFVDKIGNILWAHFPHELTEERDRSFSNLIRVLFEN